MHTHSGSASINPNRVSFALMAYGFAYREADSEAAYEVLRRGMTIAQDSGNRQMESNLAVNLSGLAATHGDYADALDYLTLAIRNYHDAGNVSMVQNPLAILAALFDRLGHYDAAATISGFAATPLFRTAFPELTTATTHLREVLGDKVYESFARGGENMSNAAMATYAFDQIEHARAELHTSLK